MKSIKEWRAMREETGPAITMNDSDDWEANLNAAISSIKRAVAAIKQLTQNPPPVATVPPQQPVVNPNPIAANPSV